MSSKRRRCCAPRTLHGGEDATDNGGVPPPSGTGYISYVGTVPAPQNNAYRIGGTDGTLAQDTGISLLNDNVVLPAGKNVTTTFCNAEQLDVFTGAAQQVMSTAGDRVRIGDGGNDYAMPTTRGVDGQVLRTAAGGDVGWSDALDYTGSGTTAVGQLPAFSSTDGLSVAETGLASATAGADNVLSTVPATQNLQLSGNTTDLKITATGVSASKPFLAPIGTAAAPSYSFLGDENTGAFSQAGDQLALVTGGASRVEVRNTNTEITNQLRTTDGSISNPGIAFATAPLTGLWRLGNDTGLTINGAERCRWTPFQGMSIGNQAVNTNYTMPNVRAPVATCPIVSRTGNSTEDCFFDTKSYQRVKYVNDTAIGVAGTGETKMLTQPKTGSTIEIPRFILSSIDSIEVEAWGTWTTAAGMASKNGVFRLQLELPFTTLLSSNVSFPANAAGFFFYKARIVLRGTAGAAVPWNTHSVINIGANVFGMFNDQGNFQNNATANVDQTLLANRPLQLVFNFNANGNNLTLQGSRVVF